MIDTLRRYWEVAAEFARIGVVRKSQLQAEFWCQVMMDCAWYASHVAVFEVLYTHSSAIAGWSRAEFRVLLGFLFVSDAFMMVWLGQLWRFGRDLKDGKLDPFRVRPGATYFLYAFQSFSLEGCVNLTIAAAYLGYGIGVATGSWTLTTVALTCVAVVVCCWARILAQALLSMAEFYMTGAHTFHFLNQWFQAASDRPVDIFGARLRAFLLYVVPMGALSQIPASIVLRRLPLWEACLTIAWLVLLGVMVLKAWHRSFRRYESGMG